MRLRLTQAHTDDDVIIEAEVKKLGYTYYPVSNALIIPLHNVKGGKVPSKPPQWFQDWSDQKFEPFVKEQKEFNKALLNCPTIKKEIDPEFLDKYK